MTNLQDFLIGFSLKFSLQHTPKSWIEANFQKRECIKFVPSSKEEQRWVSIRGLSIIPLTILNLILPTMVISVSNQSVAKINWISCYCWKTEQRIFSNTYRLIRFMEIQNKNLEVTEHVPTLPSSTSELQAFCIMYESKYLIIK